jgi:hypothetical protein
MGVGSRWGGVRWGDRGDRGARRGGGWARWGESDTLDCDWRLSAKLVELE